MREDDFDAKENISLAVNKKKNHLTKKNLTKIITFHQEENIEKES